MRERYRGAPQELDALVDCAVSARVSLAAASVRLTRIGGWRRLALRWTRGRSGWQVAAATGYLGASLGALRATPATIRLLERVARAPGGRGRTLVPLRSRGVELDFAGEVWVAGASAVALIDPTSAVPAVAASIAEESAPDRPTPPPTAHALRST